MSPGTALVQGFMVVAIVSALFGAVAWPLAKWKGAPAVGILWFLTAASLGLIGAVRVIAMQLQLGVDAERQPPLLSVALMFGVALLISLAPPSIATVLASRRKPQAGLGSAMLRAMGWSVLGLALALVAIALLELFGVPLVPSTVRPS